MINTKNKNLKMSYSKTKKKIYYIYEKYLNQ